METQVHLKSNASTFHSKRKDVLFQTQRRFSPNALAFFRGNLNGHKKSLPIVTMERLSFIFPEK